MDEFFDLPTLIVIGLAIVILFRLRSVLGTRTGNERSPLERQKPETVKAEDGTTSLRPRPVEAAPVMDDERRNRKLAAEVEQFAHGDADIATGLKAIGDADTSFTPKTFIEGAKAAYEMIVTAFASGDRQTLRNLLEKDVFEGFQSAIAAREAAGQKVDFTFVGLPKVEISEAGLDKRNAQVSVRFNAEIVSATRDKDGAIVEGNADQVQTIADEWTFARNPKARDPNWKLIATNQLA
ncbi:MAG TPA: Tim44/TimA family putative adaptor protein [Devosiaceae bacterium]|jgi:predicted lipid-binding transport protein (Tim44 family)